MREPTEAQIEAAALSIFLSEGDGSRWEGDTAQDYARYYEWVREQFRERARDALRAAANVNGGA